MPTVTSATHPNQGTWYQNDDPQLSWTAVPGTNGAPVAGYAYVLDEAPSTVPSTPPAGTAPGTATTISYVNQASKQYYFHVKAIDQDGLAGPVAHFKLLIDAVRPTAAGGLTSTSHTASKTSTDTTIDAKWSAATDTLSGVDGYRWMVTNSNTALTSAQISAAKSTTGTTLTTDALADGTYYLHILTADKAGNFSPDAVAGPFVVGTRPDSPTNVVATAYDPDPDGPSDRTASASVTWGTGSAAGSVDTRSVGSRPQGGCLRAEEVPC